MYFLLLVFLLSGAGIKAQELYTPEGVKMLENKRPLNSTDRTLQGGKTAIRRKL